MTNVISLEASKKLQEYMPEKTDYTWYAIEVNGSSFHVGDIAYVLRKSSKYPDAWEGFKSLTLEEAIEMLPSYIYSDYYYEISKEQGEYYVSYEDVNGDQVDGDCVFIDTSLIHAIEQMLLYLADNNLLK